MTDRCRWLRALGYPTGMAGLAASVCAVIWYFVGRVMPPFDFAVWLFVTEWPGLLLAVVWWDTRDLTTPEPEPRRDTVTVIDPPISNLPRRMERTGPRSATIGPGLPTGISKRDLEQWIAYVWDTRNETDSGRRVTFSVRWARDLDIDIDDGDVGNVKTWLASAGWIRIKRNEQTEVLPPGWEAFRRITRHGLEVFGE